jgi:iron complex transport system substrate-binding protein
MLIVAAGSNLKTAAAHALPRVTTSARLTTIVDDLGRRIAIAHGGARIISLSPSATEIIYAVGAQARLIAVGTRCNYPPAAARLTTLDGLNPSREMLIALHPDLIVISDQTMTVGRANLLGRQYGAPVYVTTAATYDQTEGDILRLGTAFGNPELTKKIVAGMQQAASSISARVAGLPRPRVFVVIWERPLMTAGGGSFFDNLISLAGGINVAHNESKYPQYSVERLVADNPDIILTQSEGHNEQLAVLRPLRLRAMRTAKVFTIPDDWTDRTGPRLALGLETIARDLHPEAFRK